MKNKQFSAKNKVFILGIVLWVTVIGFSLVWNLYDLNVTVLELAKAEALASFNNDLLYRRWATTHGGLYVPTTEKTPPNPYLGHISERDVVTTSGLKLTLMNPAYMTRQVHELSANQYGIRGHITSLKPIRPQNAPDAWERSALEAFESGVKEVSELAYIDGLQYLRLIKPMFTEKGCLKCHSVQGYKLGDIRGGLSVAVPFLAYANIARAYRTSLMFWHLMIGIMGLLGLWQGYKYLSRSEKELADNEEKFRSITEQVNDIIFLADNQSRIQYASPVVVDMLGFLPEEMIGKPFVEFLHGPEAESAMSELKEVISKGEDRKNIEMRMKHKNGTVFYGELSARNYLTTRFNGTISVVRNITERKKAEEEIRQLNAELENKVRERTTELSDTNAVLEEEIAERRRVEEEILVLNNDLEKKVKERTNQLQEMNNQLEENNSLLEEEIIGHQAAKEKLTEAIIQADRANAAKTTFLANMSHEIRTPLNGLVGMTQLMYMTQLADDQREYLDLMKKSADSLLRVINDVLDYAKLEADVIAVEYKPVNLRKVLNEVISLFQISAKQKGLELVHCLEQGIPKEVYCDELKLTQILSNLVGNAIKFTNKGCISISLNQKSVHDEKIELMFAVADTGIGIPRNKQDLLFERFVQLDSSYTKRYQGTGLGLAISKKLVELMGGRIWLESEEGEGSTFFFSIIVNEKLNSVLPKSPKGNRAEGTTNDDLGREDKTVLVVEDDEVSRNVIKVFLLKNNYEVLLAANGAKALELYNSTKIDLILMDVQLPVMDGFTAVRHIREWEKETGTHKPIIAMTAYALAGDREKCIAAGMDDYIKKPVDFGLLANILNKYLASSIL